MQKKQLKYIVVAILSIVSLLYGLVGRKGTEGEKKVGQPSQPSANLLRVDHVFDGDTVSVIINGRKEKVRLTGIDAPEMGQRPWGKKSRDHLEEILNANTSSVILEYDVVQRDKYGRLLGYLRTKDGRLINEMMVKDGYAVLFTFPPNVRYADKFTAAQKEARGKGLGIWGRGGLRQEPSDYRREHPRR